MKKIIHKTQKGFTLIETLTAIFVLLVVTTGPLTFSQSGLQASFFARDQVVAFYLAQDVIETIKNVRDTYALFTDGDNTDWLNNLGSCQPVSIGAAKKCTVDTAGTNVVFRACSTTCPSLYITSNGEYTQDDAITNTETRFTRTVYVTELEDEQEAQIIVHVTWDTNFFGERQVVVQENIYNWPPHLLK